jgi:hypothetical protein
MVPKNLVRLSLEIAVHGMKKSANDSSCAEDPTLFGFES